LFIYVYGQSNYKSFVADQIRGLTKSLSMIEVISREMGKTPGIPRKDKRQRLMGELGTWVAAVLNASTQDQPPGSLHQFCERKNEEGMIRTMRQVFKIHCPDLSSKDAFYIIAQILISFGIGKAGKKITDVINKLQELDIPLDKLPFEETDSSKKGKGIITERRRIEKIYYRTSSAEN